MSALIIHGHFYQPPRENPRTGLIEAQPSAAPFHDWNERIHAECYGPNAFVETATAKRESKVGNNYAQISFNFGPTLLSWLEQNHPATYQRILEADCASALNHGGHGNAIAQAYGHAILPLCNERDLRTQIRWGVADFRYRFRRSPQALWVPETACNDRVMNALIDEGLRFVILAPHQAARVRPRRIVSHTTPDNSTDAKWLEVNEKTVDIGQAYRYVQRNDPNKSMVVVFYDGALSRAIAFEKLLKSSSNLVEAFAASAQGRRMISVATDGETYGHHFKFGDLCLAHTLETEAPARGFQITNYGSFLDEFPPELEVELDNGPDGYGTSWSCAHGVGRWMRDCGCQTGGEPGWNQKWRQPLRAALDFLRDENVSHFEATRGRLFIDPWKARDESIALILDQKSSREQFLLEHAGRWLTAEDQLRALAHLELQRMLILMYTSCGWFFSDISGIETIQILSYAARAIDLMEQLGLPTVREQFLEILAQATSNRAERGTGADIYQRFVEPLRGSRVQEPMPA